MTPTYPELTTLRWSCEDESKRWQVENPATGKVITNIQAGDTKTVDQAVRAAQKAYKERWRPLNALARSKYLLRCADELEKHVDELAELLCMENGKPKQDAKNFDVTFVHLVFRYFASIVDKLPSDFIDRGSMYCTVIHEPLGVCAGILPFNWPPIHFGGKVAPAIAAGNTIIIKPGEQAPLTVIRMAEIIQSILPEGVVQVVPGLSPEVPQALIEHLLVKKVSFTGSTASGAAVAKSASASITPVVLELGGKNACIVNDDCDFDLAVRDAVDGAFFNKGEACTATSRLLVHRNIYDKFVSALAAAVKQIRAGNGMDDTTHIGPAVSKAQQQRVLKYIEMGKKEGARIAAQGKITADPECKDGFFVPPTLFADVHANMTIAQEEMFGPVVTCMPFDTLQEAIDVTNSSDYGLTAAIYTKDIMTANRVTRALDVGMVFVNTYKRNILGTPFGGVKHSGYGREHTIETLREWTQAKAVHSLSGLEEVPEWRVVKEIFGDSGSQVVLPSDEA